MRTPNWIEKEKDDPSEAPESGDKRPEQGR